MKQKLLFVFLIQLSLTSLFSQAPAKFSYQAAIRNASGSLLPNGANVAFKISILDLTASGAVLYSERITHVVNNSFGLVNLEIGTGSLVSGAWPTAAQWGLGSKFLKVEFDINGASTYVEVSTTQLISVPYAQFANSADGVSSNAKISAVQILSSGAFVGQVLKWNGTNWAPSKDTINIGTVNGITAGAGLTGGGTTGALTLDAKVGDALWNANKLQGNNIGTATPSANDVLKWDGTQWVPAAETTYTAGTGIDISGTVINSSWTKSGNNLHNNNTGNVGIMTTNPTAALSVADRFLVDGTTGGLRMTLPAGNITLANPTATSNVGIYQYTTGATNFDKYILSHSPTNKTLGLMYSDSFDRYEFHGGGKAFTALSVDLSNTRVGIGKRNPSDKLEVFDASLPVRATLQSGTSSSALRLTPAGSSGNLDIVKYPKSSSLTQYGMETKGLAMFKNDSGSLGLYSSDSITFGTNGTRKMTLTKNGYLGIGLSNPLYIAHLRENQKQSVLYHETTIDTGYVDHILATPSSNMEFGALSKTFTNFISGSDISGAGFISSQKMVINGADSLIFSTVSARRMAITSAGNVEINAPLRITSGSPGLNKVLTSNASGSASWTAPNTLPGTTAQTVIGGGQIPPTVPSGSSSVWEFAGPTVSVTITANQRVVVMAQAALGRNQTGTATNLRMDAGYQLSTSTIVNNCSGGNYMILNPDVATANSRNPYHVSGSFKPGVAGTYRVGFVVYNGTAGNVNFFNSNDFNNITVMVINE